MRAAGKMRAIARARGWTIADGWRARLVGWIGRRNLADDDGLCLMPCNAIHTFGMRLPIDAVFVDRRLRVVRCVASLPPRRFAFAWRAAAVIELPAGAAARAGLRAGARLTGNWPERAGAIDATRPVTDATGTAQ